MVELWISVACIYSGNHNPREKEHVDQDTFHK